MRRVVNLAVNAKYSVRKLCRCYPGSLWSENLSQLGVGKAEGAPKLTVVDLNGDGINEYKLENDSVRVVLLTTGARVILRKLKISLLNFAGFSDLPPSINKNPITMIANPIARSL